MLAVAERVVAPRYGSVAELAAYAGLSRKTIRRLVGSGAIRGLRVGRRVVIPFEDLDRHILRPEDARPRTREAPAMAIAPTSVPPSAVELETGRLRPLTDVERRARSHALALALDDVADITDETDTDATWAEAFRGIDEGRPHRPLFEGMH